MKASYQWIRELLPDLRRSPEELAALFTGAGLEVEGIHRYGAASRDVVVVEVVAIEPHPAKDKLKLVTVATGDGATQRVVCGASNVPPPGGLVVLAPLGTHLPAVGVTLEPKDIGGVRSEGMLVSERELGLRPASPGEGHEGILILPPGTASPGTTLADAIPASHDVIFDIGLTPNRPDGLGHVGLAREIAAIAQMPWPAPPPVRPFGRFMPEDATEIDVESVVTIEVRDHERCPRYGAAYVEGVRIGPSPRWLTWRLEALGIRSISNVVDVTNLVLLEYGHPIHAFDADRVRGKRIVVRRAAAGEVVKILDGTGRTLVDDDLVIADAEGPVALAGVMGGEGSAIHDFTSRVLVECAYFQPRGVRRTGRRHAIHTESSHRFERGVDPSDVEEVLVATCSLLAEVAGGTPSRRTQVVGELVPRPTIRLRRERMKQLLGVDIDFGEAVRILERLGCRTMGIAWDEARLVPPHHRPDLEMEADLIEEVVRVRGLDSIPTELPAIRPQAPRSEGAIAPRVRQAAIGLGLHEAMLFGFVDPKDLERVRAPRASFVLVNPLGEERSAMRTSLLPGLLDALRRARRHGVSDVRLFATGARFLEQQGEPLAREARSFAAVLAGSRDGWLDKPQPVDVWDLKGLALALVERATGRQAEVVPLPEARLETLRSTRLEDLDAPLHPRGAAEIVVGDRVVGRMGPLHPAVVAAMDLGEGALILELDVDDLEALGPVVAKYRPIPVLPAATRDVALVVHEGVPAGDVERAIRDAAGELCESVEVFDVFRGPTLPAEHRSLAFHVVYRDPAASRKPSEARTLTDAEVDQRHATVVKTVGERFGATLRA